MGKLRVLVTDDEMGMRLGVLRSLRDFTVYVPDVNETVGFVIDYAESGEESLDKIRQQPPDILLLDHKMPGISGLEVLERLADMKTDMLTVMITAYASIETAVAATKQGAYDFLPKPFTPDELKSTIRKAATRLVLARQARKLAEEKQQVRFEFIRVLGHELKSPLNAIGGYLELMKKRQLGGELSAYDEMLDRSLDRIDGMHKLIRDLLDLTQIESGRANRCLAEVDVTALAGTAIETVQAEADARKIAVRIHAEGPVCMQADAREIEMLLNNVLSNAVKYNREGGSVDVTIERRDAQVLITTADTGIGMTSEETGRIFDEFIRIKNERTQGIAGSGLGLSLVKKIAQLYNGVVNVESEPDIGSTFTISLEAGKAAQS
ncbi:MAG: response regulator [Planctomycetaceae bacterium]|nr:response regulator [Planctomycetaceae bacterium]